jgi:hypothetical protein
MKYIIPNFFDSYVYNMALINEFIQVHEFAGVQGTYSFSYFNGSLNNIRGEKISLYPDFIAGAEAYKIIDDMILLDYGNMNIVPADYKNCMAKVILEKFSTDSRFYWEVSVPEYIEYLVQTYPKIKIVLHQNYTMFHSVQDINSLISQYPNNIKGIITTDVNPCYGLKNKNIFKCYLLSPMAICHKCKNLKRCIKLENNNTLNFSEQSVFSSCPNCQTLKDVDTAIAEINYVKNNADYILFGTAMKDRIPGNSFSTNHNGLAQERLEQNRDVEIEYYKFYEDVLNAIKEDK